MKTLHLFNEEELHKQLKTQQKHNCDMELSVDWDKGIDLSKPFLPIDEGAFFFPGISTEERIVVSQLMGLIVAKATYELEEALLYFYDLSWKKWCDLKPLSPEFMGLGEQFFIEEEKHSHCFQRYVKMFAEKVGVDLTDLNELLPVLKNTKTEKIIDYHLKFNVQSVWWMVAIFEQQFLNIYKNIAPFRKDLDPLYYELHFKHYKEEAIHSPFPYLMIQYLDNFPQGFFRKQTQKVDLASAQVILSCWIISSFNRVRNIKKFEGKHEFFRILKGLFDKPLSMGIPKVLWKFLTETPYVGELINTNVHQDIINFAAQRDTFSLPTPSFEEVKLVNY